MTMPHPMPHADQSAEASLRDALSRGDLVLGKIGPILGHLLSTPDHSLFSDEIVARVRGMLHDLAWQVLRAQAQAAGQSGREAFAERHGEALAEHLQASPALLAHCHALALEWQFASRMEAQYGLDPVLSPLIQQLIAAEDSAISSAAMAALAAQARFAQTQQRMELPLAELPGDLFHQTLLGWRNYNGPNQSDAMIRAEAKLRDGFDESGGRIALFARLVAGLGDDATEALVLDKAGAAIFFTSLAARSGQSREMAILSSNKRQLVRLALGLRAAGLDGVELEDVIMRIHPDAAPPQSVLAVTPSEAQQLLTEGGMLGIG
ncbi:hypothetical protein [Qipengyuania marisflavi]|uniref:Uncharacterized protein n=1 Tax=Qipengyuania marisflavi TaxID=2486356 RepID=A0A5S3P961_9SPHN|nr:hypothetical protein [Qipengyuania marisflavi]TMM49976.1 hypothetical protein FEV51_01905 [Qipengyuania marisflavi]